MPSDQTQRKTLTPMMNQHYAEHKTKDKLPLWWSDARLSSQRACHQTSTMSHQQDSCSMLCSAHLTFHQCGYTQHTDHRGFHPAHSRNWIDGAAMCPTPMSGSLMMTFYCGAPNVHSCLSPSEGSPPACEAWSGRQKSGKDQGFCFVDQILEISTFVRFTSDSFIKVQ